MKQKTNRAASKRFKFSSRGKAKRLLVHQSHFNAKDTGKDTRRKHKSANVHSTDLGRLIDLLPYN